MNCYETLFVVKPTLTEEETTAQIDKVKSVLEKEGAELLGTNDMGMRKLAYSVQKHNRGYYTVLFYKANGITISELERNLKINEEVIKFLSIKYSKTKEMTQFNKLVALANKGKEEAQTPAPIPVAQKQENIVVAEEAITEVVEVVETTNTTEA